MFRGISQLSSLLPALTWKLVVLAIEPFAMAIRAHENISGVRLGQIDHHIPLFANDVILFLTDLSNSIPTLLDVTKNFGLLSGYRVNNAKSSLMLLNEDESHSPMDCTSSFCLTDNFTHLGVHIVPEMGRLVQTNYDPVLESISKSLERWSHMPISLIGQNNILKINNLPKLLYLFQNIPLPLPTSYFSKLKKICLNFLWNNRRHRLRLTLLYLPYERGGLKLPSFLWYYCTAAHYNVLFLLRTDPSVGRHWITFA